MMKFDGITRLNLTRILKTHGVIDTVGCINELESFILVLIDKRR